MYYRVKTYKCPHCENEIGSFTSLWASPSNKSPCKKCGTTVRRDLPCHFQERMYTIATWHGIVGLVVGLLTGLTLLLTGLTLLIGLNFGIDAEIPAIAAVTAGMDVSGEALAAGTARNTGG